MRPGGSCVADQVYGPVNPAKPNGVNVNEYGVPGVAFGIVKNGQVTARGFGVTNVDDPKDITPDTVFAIGSVTKSVTAAGVF